MLTACKSPNEMKVTVTVTMAERGEVAVESHRRRIEHFCNVYIERERAKNGT